MWISCNFPWKYIDFYDLYVFFFLVVVHDKKIDNMSLFFFFCCSKLVVNVERKPSN